MELVGAGWSWRGAGKKQTEADPQGRFILEVWGLIWLELSPKTYFLLILPGMYDTNATNGAKRGPEGPKRLQYDPKASLEASGGALGTSRGQQM